MLGRLDCSDWLLTTANTNVRHSRGLLYSLTRQNIPGDLKFVHLYLLFWELLKAVFHAMLTHTECNPLWFTSSSSQSVTFIMYPKTLAKDIKKLNQVFATVIKEETLPSHQQVLQE